MSQSTINEHRSFTIFLCAEGTHQKVNFGVSIRPFTAPAKSVYILIPLLDIAEHRIRPSKRLMPLLSFGDKKTALSIFVTTLLLVACTSASPPAAEEEKVVETMRLIFIAAANDDLSQFHSVTWPDFYAFDGGKKVTGDDLMTFVKNAHAAGKVYTWQVTEPQVHVEGQMAWITYFNRGSLQDTAGKKDLVWLESAVLRKSDGVWRIQFLHSTRMSPQ